MSISNHYYTYVYVIDCFPKTCNSIVQVTSMHNQIVQVVKEVRSLTILHDLSFMLVLTSTNLNIGENGQLLVHAQHKKKKDAKWFDLPDQANQIGSKFNHLANSTDSTSILNITFL